MSTSINDLIRVLSVTLGFECEDAKDHVRYVLRINGKIIARTKFSHSWRGSHQIDDSILSLQAKQMHCSNKTLKGLLRKQLGKQDYFLEILENSLIDQVDFDTIMQ